MTARGFGTGALGVLLLAAGLALRWSAIAVVGAVLLVLVLAALRVAVRRTEITIVRSIAPHRVPRRQVALAVFQIESRTGSPSFELHQPIGDSGRGPRVAVPRLGRRGRVPVSRELPTSTRGIHLLRPVELRRSDPFGFVAVTKRQCGTDSLVVTPRIEALRPLDSGLSRSIDAPVAVAMSQGSMVFDRIREYVDGDDTRLIDWRATARSDDQFLVRQHVDTTLPATVVLLDDAAGAYPAGGPGAAALDEAIDVTASVIASARHAGTPVELQFTSGRAIDEAIDGSADPQIDALTRLTPSATGSLDLTLRSMRGVAGAANLVVVGGAVGTATLDAAAALATRFDRVVVCRVHPDGTTGLLPAPPRVTALSVTCLEELPRLWSVAVAR